MTKNTDIEVEQLKTAVYFLAAMLEEGSLVARYHRETREEIAEVLRNLVEKVEHLPDEIPARLVEAAAVRAVIDASEQYNRSEREQKEAFIQRRMREAEMASRLKGCALGPWEQIGPWEYQASSPECEGFVYVSPDSTYDLLDTSRELLID